MFSDGLNIAWNNQTLGKMTMPNVSLIGDVGATLNIEDATFEVSDSDVLEKFTEVRFFWFQCRARVPQSHLQVLLNEESFDWEISGGSLVVSALGMCIEVLHVIRLLKPLAWQVSTLRTLPCRRR